MDLGIILEGIIELDPMTSRMVLRIQQKDGSNKFVDVQECLEKYKGEEVRFIMTPLRTVDELTKLVKSGKLPVDEVPKLKIPNRFES